MELLHGFLAKVPRTWRAALEFRHDSWFDDEVYDALRAHDIALVAVDEDEQTTPLVPTASWGYLRLRKTRVRRRRAPGWAERIGGQPWDEAYVFLKHDEDTSAGPSRCAAGRDGLGLQVRSGCRVQLGAWVRRPVLRCGPLPC